MDATSERTSLPYNREQAVNKQQAENLCASASVDLNLENLYIEYQNCVRAVGEVRTLKR